MAVTDPLEYLEAAPEDIGVVDVVYTADDVPARLMSVFEVFGDPDFRRELAAEDRIMFEPRQNDEG